MITRSQATSMLKDFENELKRTGYETCDKRPLINLFSYVKRRVSDPTIYGRTDKLKAVEALERRWHQDRIGKPITGDHGEIFGFDPVGTGRGSKTIGAILRELRALLVELPVTVPTPAPILFPPMVALGVSPASITDAALDASVARVLAQKRELASA